MYDYSMTTTCGAAASLLKQDLKNEQTGMTPSVVDQQRRQMMA